jgi:predicted amidohydrolase YtcJ
MDGDILSCHKKNKRNTTTNWELHERQKRLPPEISFRTPASWRADTHICMLIRDIAARALGVSAQTGSLEVGKDADPVLFDKSFTVSLTVVKGTIVFSKL